jgi:transposase
MSTRTRISLTPEQRLHLENLIRSGSALARTLTKARILLMTDRSQGKHLKDAEIAASLLVNAATVGRTRRRFVSEGMEAALYDKPRPGIAPKITGDIEAKLTVLACSAPPEGRDRWTLQLLADKVVELGYLDSISSVAIYKRLKKTNLSLGRSNRGASAKRQPDS